MPTFCIGVIFCDSSMALLLLISLRGFPQEEVLQE